MHNFKVGDRVRDRWDRSHKGNITDINTGHQDEVEVQWDNGSLLDEEVSELVLHDPIVDGQKIAAAQVKIDEATISLENAFKAWQEAAEVFGGSKFELAEDPLINVKKFEAAIEKAGWEISSLYC